MKTRTQLLIVAAAGILMILVLTAVKAVTDRESARATVRAEVREIRVARLDKLPREAWAIYRAQFSKEELAAGWPQEFALDDKPTVIDPEKFVLLWVDTADTAVLQCPGTTRPWVARKITELDRQGARLLYHGGMVPIDRRSSKLTQKIGAVPFVIYQSGGRVLLRAQETVTSPALVPLGGNVYRVRDASSPQPYYEDFVVCGVNESLAEFKTIGG